MLPPKPILTMLTGPGAVEMVASSSQISTLANSPTGQALNKMTPLQKAQLRQAISAVQQQVIQAVDTLNTRVSRVDKQINILGTKIGNTDSGKSTYNTFHRLFQPAINSDSVASSLSLTVKSASDTVVDEIKELQYQQLVATVQKESLLATIQSFKQALGDLDRISTSLV